MKNFNKFIKKIKSLEIKPVEYIETKAGWLRKDEYPKVPFTNNSFLWEIESINENKLKILQSDAISELILLTPDQLKQVLKRLELINSFSNFYEFIKVFYVKVANNNYNGLDISDFKINLETCFYAELPKKGNFDINFLNELLPQIFFKHSLLEGLKFQIDNLNTEPQLISEHNLQNTQDESKIENSLKEIWMPETKLSFNVFLKLGIEKGIWDKQYKIITAKNSLYSNGKTLLGSLSISLKGYAISQETDYKVIGNAFCDFFNIPINDNIKEPYKAFSSGNEKTIKQFKRTFNIK